MSVSSLQAKKVLTYEQFGSPTTARSRGPVHERLGVRYALSSPPEIRMSLTSPVKRFLASYHW